ncbi:unnamed protein product [Ambrosiozyma monospora]|uniref:Unnamed protein product n=1 Tax=Ambrosiozyma monospora TaxID=43982 RepID=A0ACB5TWV4_AMBMO|nr:unnamed protein product [Ambrosiozyma monospora]
MMSLEGPEDARSVLSGGSGPIRAGSVRVTGRPSLALSAHNTNLTRPSMNPSLITAKTAKEMEYSAVRPLKSSLELIRYIQSNPTTAFSKKVKFFLLSIALCHTCIPRKVETKLGSSSSDTISSIEQAGEIANANITGGSDKSSNTPPGASARAEDPGADDDDESVEIDYQAASPDELALVQAASDMGFVFWDKKLKKLTLKLYPNGFDEEPVFEDYELLEVVDFTSARKRMSCVVRFPDGKIIMLCKGADNVILERLRDVHMVSKKQNELTRNVSQRKKTEAELILQKTHDESGTPIIGRLSTSSLKRSSIQMNRTSTNGSDSLPAIDTVLGNEQADQDIGEIVKKSRKSMQLQQKDKYNFTEEHSYIPPDQLVLNDEFVLERTLQHIEEFSSDGLRTLLYSYRYLDEKTYQAWAETYAKAKTAIHNRADKIQEAGCMLENNFELLGCTAIEDKLQEGVPEAIEKLRRAGIRMWIGYLVQ